jgi:hypothetical protein
MNDSELDRMLDAWQAPAPPPDLRRELRARFPRGERRRFGRPVRWLLAIGVASAALAVGTEQSGDWLADSPIVRVLGQLYGHVVETLEAHRLAAIVWRIRQSEPQTSVDGRPAPPIEFRRSVVFDVQVPGDGIYSMAIFNRGLVRWEQAGRIHGSTIEFQAGAHHVVIQCNQPLVDSDMPVLVRRRRE